MSILITLVGLGQIGTSIGLALAEQTGSILRIGHDLDPAVARRAHKLGAIDKVAYNLPNGVRDADLVVLALPLDQIHATLQIITPDLKESAVVMDTAPVKEIVLRWIRELLPPDRHYVGVIPVLNPAYLHDERVGIEAAREDLFKDGMMAIVTGGGTNSDALKMATDLTRLLGATPLFTDPVEADSLMAAIHILPHLMAAGLLDATATQPGWQEARKFAGRAFTQVTSPPAMLDGSDAVVEAALQDQEHVLRVLENLITSITAIKERIATRDREGLQQLLMEASKARSQWWNDRLAADWNSGQASDAQLPSAREFLGRLIFGGRPRQED